MTCFFIQCWIHEMVRMTALNFVSAGILQCPEGAVKEIWRANRHWTIDVCCNSTLFNARPKTSWKSCQSSWRNWRSRPSTRQVGRLQIVNSKLTIGQKSLDNMNIVHNNVIVYATYFHLCQYWYSHYGFRFSRTEHMISFVSLVMVMTMMMLMLLLLMMMMIAHITWNTRWWPLAYTDAYWSEGYFGHILASWDE